MICPSCKTVNDDDAAFCKNCGRGMYGNTSTGGEAEQSINYLLIFIGWFCFTTVLWFIIQQVAVPIMIKNYASANTVSKIYQYVGTPTEVITLILAIVFAILSKHRMTRIVLLIFSILKIGVMIGTILIPLLSSGSGL